MPLWALCHPSLHTSSLDVGWEIDIPYGVLPNVSPSSYLSSFSFLPSLFDIARVFWIGRSSFYGFSILFLPFIVTLVYRFSFFLMRLSLSIIPSWLDVVEREHMCSAFYTSFPATHGGNYGCALLSTFLGEGVLFRIVMFVIYLYGLFFLGRSDLF